jgi:hypothetical protein
MNINNFVKLVTHPTECITLFIEDVHTWILGKNIPPTLGSSGLWIDAELWVDTNIWWD